MITLSQSLYNLRFGLMAIKKIDNYRIRLNQILGVNANTYMGYNNLSKEEVVIKAIPKNQILKKFHVPIQNFKQNVRYLHKIRKNTSYVVRYLNLLQNTSQFYIILEFCKGGNLKKLLSEKHLSPNQSFKYMRHILKGFVELIKKGIIHGNLSPQNILFHNGLMRLADFGLNSNFRMESSHSQIKNTNYMAPQVLQGKRQTCKSDIWSLGFVFFQMTYGYAPWKTGRVVSVYLQRLKSEPLYFPAEPQVSQDLKFLIRGCLQFDPKNRIQWEQIYSNCIFTEQFSQMLLIDIRLGFIIGNIRDSLYESNLDLQRFFQSRNLVNSTVLNQHNFQKVVQSINPQLETQDIRYLFNLFDTNKTQMIQFTDFKNSLENFDISIQFQPFHKKKNLNNEIQSKNTILGKQQILEKALQKLIYQIKANKIYDLYDIFIQNDKDLSEILDFRQLSVVLRRIQPRLNDQQCRSIYKKMDLNNDNQISFKKFMKSMCIFTGSRYKQTL